MKTQIYQTKAEFDVKLKLTDVERDWLEDAALTLEPMLHRFGRFTSDDLRRVLPPPAGVNWFGILFAKLKNKGLIRRVSAQPSARPEANGRLVSVWEAVQ